MIQITDQQPQLRASANGHAFRAQLPHQLGCFWPPTEQPQVERTSEPNTLQLPAHRLRFLGEKKLGCSQCVHNRHACSELLYAWSAKFEAGSCLKQAGQGSRMRICWYTLYFNNILLVITEFSRILIFYLKYHTQTSTGSDPVSSLGVLGMR